MASNISQLKQQVAAIGNQATSLAGQLQSLTSQFQQSIAAVQGAIGGTASGEDKEMIAAFEQANESVKNASSQLQAAGRAAKDWAAKA